MTDRQQKLAQIETQEITQLLQAPRELGTNKLLINVNGQSSKIVTNKNGIIKYTLEQPTKLNIGDVVTLIDSFVEERGLAEDTIQFEEDVVEEIRFLYYTQGDLRNTQSTQGDKPYDAFCADMEFAHFPSFFPDGNSGSNLISEDLDFTANDPTALLKMDAYNAPMFPTWNYKSQPQGSGNQYKNNGGTLEIEKFGIGATGVSASNGVKDMVTTGATGQYYYMMEFFSPVKANDTSNIIYSWQDADLVDDIGSVFVAQKSFMRPLYGATTITVPAGNYSVSALSDLINNQLNGSIASATKTQETLLTERLYGRTKEETFKITVPPFAGLFSSTTDLNTDPISEYNPDSLIIGEDTHQPFQRRRGDVVTQFYFNSNITGNRVNLQCARYVNEAPNGVPNTANTHAKYHNGALIQRYNGQPNLDPTDPTSNTRTDFHNGITCGDLQVISDPIYTSDKFRAFNSNFYMHLEGFRYFFENTNSQYFTQDDSTDFNIIENFGPQDFPTLADLFLCNVGLNGLKYFQQDPDKWNHGGYDVSAIANPDDYPWTYSNNPEEYIFSTLFGVSGQGDSARPFWENSTAETTAAGFDATLPVQKPTTQQFAGTTAIEVSFDIGKTNRFRISNLHEPYKLQNITANTGGSTGMGGQEATSLAYPAFFDFTGPVSGFINQQISPPCGIYPVEAVGGIAVNNFSFNSVKSTKVYKDLVDKIQANNVENMSRQMYREKLIYDLFTKPYEDFFNSEAEAKTAWSKTIWARIGFTYEQIGSIADKLESVFSFSEPNDTTTPSVFGVKAVKSVKQKGIITHNAYDNSFVPSSGGLGVANPYSQAVQTGKIPAPQSYGLRSAGCGVNQEETGNIGFQQNRINILSNTQPITADDFPALNNGNNYLVIESDIVKPNAKDAKSNQTTIVGIISKENANNDTLFHNTPIPFTVTQPKLLSTIEVRIRNPDGTLVSDDIVGKNNGFIFQVEKAIAPEAMTLESF